MEAKFCRSCGKKPTRTRTIDATTALCIVCSNKQEQESTHEEETDDIEMNDDAPLSEIRFGDLKNWLQKELHASIKEIVKEEMKLELSEIKKDANEMKKEVTKNKQSVASCSSRIDRVDVDIKKIQDEKKEESSISKNNLKYLINLDRNERRQNILIFGVPEGDLTIDGDTAKTDIDKCQLLFRVMNIQEVCRNAIKEMFRFGKLDETNPGKCRPMKVRFISSAPASAAFNAKQKLNDIVGQTIYIKPDKTKSEQEEFKRIGKRKTDVLQEYNNDADRVKLTKGVLYVDGVEVDRYKSVQSLF